MVASFQRTYPRLTDRFRNKLGSSWGILTIQLREMFSREEHPGECGSIERDSRVEFSSLARRYLSGEQPRRHGVNRRELLAGALLTLCTAAVSGQSALLANAAAQSPGGLPDVDPRRAFGSKSAPLTMEIFSDFQCPACRQFFLNNNRQLLDNYVNTGKVYLIYRDFPLPAHAYSSVAARYARAATQIGKFEQVEQALYQNQDKWSQNGDVDGTVASVLTPAEMNKVRSLVKNGSSLLDSAIEKDKALGRQYAVSQTPSTYIHFKGQTYPVTGVVSFDVLRSFLDQLLAQR